MARVRTNVPTFANANFTSKFQEEKLIPLINLTRKLSLCNLHHQLTVLPQLARIFQSDEVSFSLMDIIVKGICQSDVYGQIPIALYDHMNSILPSDKELNLRDSVYESRLVEEEGRNEDEQTIKKKKKLPMTLLRIPTDLQCHIFHYLHFNEFPNVQQLCRAMCIAARNPSAIYMMQFNPRLAMKVQFQKECFSRPKKLMIHPSVIDAQLETKPIIGNKKWGNHVIDLNVTGYDRSADMVFFKLERCEIYRSPTILLNGSISSYHTLKELTLNEITLTENMINRIQKFQNLEELSLIHPSSNDDGMQHLDPISLPKLKVLSYAVSDQGFVEFQRFLVGSKPGTLIEIDATLFHVDRNVPQTGMQIPNMSPIAHCTVFCNYYSDFADSMREWLNSAPSSTFKLFNQINVTIIEEDELWSIDSEYISSLISIFQHSNRSKLDITCAPLNVNDCDMDKVVNEILKAPFGTFTEIKMRLEFELLGGCERSEDQLYMKYLWDSLDQAKYSLDSFDEEKSAEKVHNIVRKVVMESVDDAEAWLEPWMMLNEQRIKTIGLQKLDIEFKCGLKPNYDCATMDSKMKAKRDRREPFINEMVNDVLRMTVLRWGKCGRQCITATKDGQGFTVKLSL